MRDFQSPGRSAVFAERGMCATSHPLAAAVAVDILKQGGNAVDAAIAGAVVMGVCEPQMTGLGGDCFALVRPADTDDVVALNASGKAPAAISADQLRAGGATVIEKTGPASITVPGAVDGFCALSERYGKLGLAASLAPSIDYFESGVPVAPRVAFDWESGPDLLTGRARDLFLANGAPLNTGQVFRAPEQVAVLRGIAEKGRDAFYTGQVAEDMVESLRAYGGVHTLDDFAAQDSLWGKPVSGTYGDLEVLEHPPNGQGVAALLLMNILSEFDIAGMDPWGAERVHIEAEATKLAYDARNRFIADPAQVGQVDRFLDPDLAKRLAGLVDPTRAMAAPASITEAVHKDTIYITVVDRDRMAVSLIYSIFATFGSGYASDRYGILFHNRGAGFSLTEGNPNEIGPGKRPMHTIIPGFLRKEGKVLAPFGVMGGQYQATGHARFVSNLVDFGLRPQDNYERPRSFALDGLLQLERGYDDSIAAALSDKGHVIERLPGAIGGAQCIMIDPVTGVLEGGSDPRKDGIALGY